MLRRHLQLLAAASTFVFGLVVTLAVWRDAQHALNESVHQRFIARVANVQDIIRGRVGDYAQVLRSGTGVFAGSQGIRRREWATYVQALRLEFSYPGMAALGILMPIPQAERA